MTDYVIDENVIMESIHGKKPNGEPAYAESELMYRILRNDDRIVINSEIIKKIYSIPKKIKINHSEKSIDNILCKKLMDRMINSDRVLRVDNANIDFKGPKKCDKQFVSASLQSGAILITADDKIKGPISEGGSVVSRCICQTAKEILDSEN